MERGIFMKSLMPWVCLVVASASQSLYAEDDFSAYRLGNYNKASLPLISKSDKDPVANYYLGRLYLYGYGQLRNFDLAMSYFTKAAEKGYLPAIQVMAKYSLIKEKNPEQAIRWFKQAAQAGDVNAQVFMGGAYLLGFGVKKNTDVATKYFIDAAKNGNALAQYQLAEQFLDSKHAGNAKLGIIWLTKSANNGNPKAMTRLASYYTAGKLVDKDPEKATELLNKAAAQNYLPAKIQLGQAPTATEDKNKKAASPAEQMAMWLTNDSIDQLDKTDYQMTGIFSAWQNPMALRNNNYNQAPQLEVIDRQAIFKPKFELSEPKDIPLDSFYEALVSKKAEFPTNQFSFPTYRLNRDFTVLERVNSYVLQRQDLPVPYEDASYYNYEDFSNASIWDIWLDGWEKQANYGSVFSQLYFRAVLGDGQTQFDIGQLFQYGIGVEQNDASAIIFYQNAASEQHLPSMYNLGILYLQHAKEQSDYDNAMNWLNDAAFKGNRQAQYAVAKILEEGRTGPDGKEYIKPNPEQALSMLYVSASNQFGPAQYELAEHLARELNNGLSVTMKKQKLAIIRQLYQGAAANGVAQAFLPLAYYNAMESDKDSQALAFAIADEQANAGEPKAALLLGLLYDRGIGVATDPAKAMFWYQKAGQNPVSQFILGTYTAEGKGIPQDKEKALALLNAAADAQFSYATFNLAVLKQQAGKDFIPELNTAYGMGNSHAGIVLADYYLSQQTDQDKGKQAKDIYAGLAAKGDQYAQLKLGYMYEHGLGVSVDPNSAQQWLTASANQGNATAQFLLAQFYQVGLLGEPNYALAKEWYKKAAEQLPKAAVGLGFLYETVDDNYVDALKAYDMAANQGDGLGLYNKALMYFYGKGMPVDYQKAKSLFNEAGNKGVADALNQLASINFNGLGQSREEQQGISLYKKAAELGDSAALYELGLLSETGVGTKLDFPDALKYYQEAANKGNEKAMFALARMYFYGIGVEKNLKLALDMYQQLADRENPYAEYYLGMLYMDGRAGEQSIDKGKRLLEKAGTHGNLQAQQELLRMAVHTQDRVSFVEPVTVNNAPLLIGQSADMLYLDAMNEWNRGNEVLSRSMLNRLVTEYPHFVPAKRVFDQIKQSSVQG